MQLLVGLVADWVWNKNPRHGIRVEYLGLVVRLGTEFCGKDAHAGQALDLEAPRVVNLTRGAASSVGQTQDHRLALLSNSLAQRRGTRAGERGLGVTMDGAPQLLQEKLHAIEQGAAPGLGYVHQPDRLGKPARARGSQTERRHRSRASRIDVFGIRDRAEILRSARGGGDGGDGLGDAMAEVVQGPFDGGAETGHDD